MSRQVCFRTVSDRTKNLHDVRRPPLCPRFCHRGHSRGGQPLRRPKGTGRHLHLPYRMPRFVRRRRPVPRCLCIGFHCQRSLPKCLPRHPKLPDRQQRRLPALDLRLKVNSEAGFC
ncbi:hypothetical protein C8J57DRAFT_1731308 [Mycena rebaudengoi]|nr:hypothetical protein C8J57DRAFT_1731308 [Mycena rebaudengoi]